MRFAPRFLAPLAGSVALLLVHADAQIMWSDNPLFGDWNTPDNWIGANIPDTLTEQAVFGASAITFVNLSAATTANKLIVTDGAPSYFFSGSALTLDVNAPGAGSADAILVGANVESVNFSNAVVFRDANGGDTPSNVNVGAGSVVNFNAAVSTQNNRNLQSTGNGTLNFNFGSTLTLGTGQLQHAGNSTMNLFIDPASTGQIRSFSNGGGGIRIHVNMNDALGLGVTGSTSHVGRIFLVENGITTTGTLSTGGGTGGGTHTMDVTFGTDISGTGSATHSGAFSLSNLGGGVSGSSGIVRVDVGTDDTFTMTGAITGSLGGYSAPQLIKQGTGTLIATGANTYTVPTQVAAGTMIVTTAQTGGSAITVNDGATFGVRQIAAGAAFNTPLLTIGSVTGGNLLINLLALPNPTSAVINATTFNPNTGTVINLRGGNLSVGTFPVIDYATIGGAGFAGLSLTLPPRIVGMLRDNTANTSVDVEIQGIDIPKWRGNVSTTWDFDDGSGAVGTLNWFAPFSNVATRYIQSPTQVDAVIFDDTAVNPMVDLPGDVSPTAVNINNDTLTLVFNGFGRITGTGLLVKQGAGTAIFNNFTPYDYTGATTVSGGTLQIGDGFTFGAGYLPANGVVNNATVALNRPDDAILPGNISGSGAVNKLGINNLTLTGSLTYTGITTIANGTLTLSPTAAYTLPSQIAGPGSLAKAGTPTVMIAGNATYTGATTISAGVLQFGDAALGAPVGARGLFGSPGPSAITVNAGSVGFGRADTALVVPNVISGAGGVLIAGSFGSIVTLTGENTFTGGVNISGGGLRILNVNALGTGAKTITITNGTAGQPSLHLNGAAGNIILPASLSFTTSSTDAVNSAIVNEAGDNVINGNFTLTDGGGATRIRVEGGTLTLNGSFTANRASRVLILDGTGNGLITGAMSNANTPGLQKDGSGTWRMTGAHIYTGATNVNAGTLITTTAQTGATPVTVAATATFGVQTLVPGALFAVPSLTLNGGTLQLDPGLSLPTTPLVLASAFTAAAGSTIRPLGAFAVGTYTAVDYDGAIGGSGFAGLALTLPSRVTGQLVDNALNTSVDIQILTVNFPVWTGASTSAWDIDNGTGTGTQNWKEQSSGNVTRYRQNAPDTDAVTFDDSATGSTTIDLSTTLTPFGVVVNNTTRDYTFSGAGRLSGSGSLAKMGNGKLTLLNTGANDYTGTTTIAGGTLQVGDGATAGLGSLGSGPIVFSGGTLSLNRPDDLSLSNKVDGTGTLVKATPNTLSFTSAFNLSGSLQLNGGIARFTGGGNIAAAITGSGGLRVEGGTLQLSGFDTNTYTGLTTVAAGTLQLNKGAGDAIPGDLLLTGTGGLTLMVPNQIADTATITYDKGLNGGNVIIGNETFGALNIVNGNDTGGQVQGNNGFAVTGLMTIGGTGVFSMASSHTGSVGGVNLTSAGALIRIAANSGPSTLVVGTSGITAAGGIIQVGQGTGAFNAELVLSGDYHATGDVTFTDGGFGGIELRQITLDAVRTFEVAAATTTTINPDIAGGGGVTKTGNGTLTFTASNSSTYTGPTAVNGGTLLINGTLNGSTGVTVAGGTLGGVGFVSAPVTVTSGSLAPGVGPGLFTLGSTTFGGGAFSVELFGPFAGLNYDQLSTNSLTLSGDTALSIDLGFYDPLDDGSEFFTIIDNTGLDPIAGTGHFVVGGNILEEGDAFFAGTQAFQISYLGGSGNDVVLVAIPEPTVASLLPLASVALLGFRRKRRL